MPHLLVCLDPGKSEELEGVELEDEWGGAGVMAPVLPLLLSHPLSLLLPPGCPELCNQV